MARRRRKPPATNVIPEEDSVETPAVDKPAQWLTWMGSAPTIFHNSSRNKNSVMQITPKNGVQQRLKPVTFGSFLPLKFQPISEGINEGEGEILRKDFADTQQVHRRLQFSAQVKQVQICQTSGDPKELKDKRDTMQQNRSPQKGKSLCYVPPDMPDSTFVVQIEDEETKEQEAYWSSALIGFVLGEDPYERAMDNFITNVLDFVSKPQVLHHEEGYYIFRFDNSEDKDLVLQAGLYTFHNKPFVLQHWRMYFKYEPGSLSVIPLWITFPGFPLGFWSTEAPRKLASVVGKPMYTDRITAKLEKISYARILVEIDISQPLPDSFELHTKRGFITQ